MQEYPLKPTTVPSSLKAAEDARDCLQCLIILYGETHIDTLAQLLNLTAYAESKFSQSCVRRLHG